MSRWILAHPAFASHVVGFAYAVTLMYGIGHMASAFGVELGAIAPARPIIQVCVGLSLLISSLTCRNAHRRLRRLVDRKKAGDRQWMARAIWERAQQNRDSRIA